ncbi:MAG: aldehyde dehydrogenase EutE, partial [Krumholzibacteria bacterium]|nr:aldehyde dehydrogenase EutE [Candidatus Krumholzibacteria bacterium]
LQTAGRQVMEGGAGDGVFATVDDCVDAARAAFHNLAAGGLEQRRGIIAAMRAAMREHGERLARLAWQETGLGRWEHKVLKNALVTEKTPGTEALQPRTVTGDAGLTLTELAPFGVIGSITPTTNPTSTIICNALGMVAAGNSVVFNVHPGAAQCSMETIRELNRAITRAGGPQNLVTAVAAPTIESAGELMRHRGIRLLVVTGGPGVVKAAMQSGKRAICAGPGNPPVVVDETADIDQAGRDIVFGAGFDNNVICVDEKEVFVVASVADRLVGAMRSAGAYLVDRAELRRLEKLVFQEIPAPRTHGVMNKDCVGRNAGELLSRIGVRPVGDPPLIVAEVPEDHPLVWSEQMMPVLPVVRVPDVDRAIALAREAEHGFGHSASMFSRDIEALSRMARVMNTSIFVKNAPIVAGLGQGGEGHTSFTIASPTGEGMTDPVSFSRQRRCVLKDHFRIV